MEAGVSADDAGGAMAAYSSTYSAYPHFADRVSVFSNAQTATGLDLRADGSDSSIRFYTGGVEDDNQRMRINDEGNVTIGAQYEPLSRSLFSVGGTHPNQECSIYGTGRNIAVYGDGDITGVLGHGERTGVLIADPDNDESIIKASEPYDSTVVGIVSTEPHMVMGMELIMDEETGVKYDDVDAVMLALAGRVPVKVTNENGSIQRGDLLTTSSKSGYAMKWTLLDISEAEDFEQLKSMLAENERRRNAVVAKALENSDSADDTIMALVNLQ